MDSLVKFQSIALLSSEDDGKHGGTSGNTGSGHGDGTQETDRSAQASAPPAPTHTVTGTHPASRGQPISRRGQTANSQDTGCLVSEMAYM